MLLAAAIAIIFLASIVRGYSGLGFSILAITALSLIYRPTQIIPSIFLLEIAASIHLLPGLWRDIHWRSLMPLVIGTAIGTPIGLTFLTTIPAAPMQIALAYSWSLSPACCGKASPSKQCRETSPAPAPVWRPAWPMEPLA